MLRIANIIANDICNLVREVMSGDTGINTKVNRNTLTDSELFKSVKATAKGDIVIELLLNDYIIYVESGRRAGAKMPPFRVIEKWCERKGLPTDVSTVWAICRAIARDGIAQRPVMATVFNAMDNEQWSGKWLDDVFNEICEVLDNYFR